MRVQRTVMVLVTAAVVSAAGTGLSLRSRRHGSEPGRKGNGRPIVLEATTEMGRPPARVFERVSADHETEWNAPATIAMERLTEGPTRVGTRYRGRMRRLGGFELRFVEYDPPRQQTLEFNTVLGRIQDHLRYEDLGGSTRVHDRMEVHLKAPLRPLGPLLRPLMLRELRRTGWRAKAYAERDD